MFSPKSLLLLILIVPCTAYSQFKNIKLDEQRDDGDYICEPSIAINPRYPNNIVAASVLNNIYFTKDGGTTWQKREVKSSMGVYGDPAIIADEGGHFYFFHLSDPTQGKGDYDSEKLDRIVVQRSSDGGDTWTDGDAIGFNHPKDQDKEWPAVDSKGNLYLAWTQFDKYGDSDPNCHSNIMWSTSRNGTKWSEPVKLSQIPGNCMDDDNTAEGAVPAVVDTKVFVAWGNQGKFFLDRSFNGGNTWLTNDISIGVQPGGWDMKVPGHDRCNGMPVLMVDKSKSPLRGSLYLAWADQRNGEGNTDIWFMRSSNYGDNWSAPIRINNDNSNRHQYLPWMTVDAVTGYIYIVYYDRRDYEDLRTDVYVAFSSDGGVTFKNVKISESPFVPDETKFFGDYTNISAYKGVIAPIWGRMDDGKMSVWTSIIKHEDLEAAK
jgi:hypothetical protein